MKVCAFLLLAASSWAQSTAAPPPIPPAQISPDAVVTRLSPLAYPRLAWLARISGDVKLAVRVRPDGTVASVDVLSGPPMLKDRAVENVRKSEFDCKGCTAETEYQLTYTFGFAEQTPQELASYDKFVDKPVRAGKCLYLWKCATVRVNTFDWCNTHFPSKITQSPGHVIILDVDNACVQPATSSLASR